MVANQKFFKRDGVRKNTAWIHKHYKEYRGKWIVLNEGILLGNHYAI